MPRPRLVALIFVLAIATLADAGARRTVWMDPDPGGRRPELPMFASAVAATACSNAAARTREQSAAPAEKPGESARRAPQTADAAWREQCRGAVPLRHGTQVELISPPGACGETLVRVRVLDGTYRGRVGCVHPGGIRAKFP